MVRSAMAPETMVAAVAQKTVWKMRKAQKGTPCRSHGRSVIAFGSDASDPAEEAVAGSEHDAEAHEPENGGSDTEVHEVFHDDVAGIFGPGETGLYHGETGLHEEDQSGADKYPDCVYC